MVNEITTKQYTELKKKHPEVLLLFRNNEADTYESYFEDAQYISDLCKDIKQVGNIASFPHQQLDYYLPKFVRAGRRIAICEQIQEYKTISRK
jgi:DNA mismatch repair protein MutS